MRIAATTGILSSCLRCRGLEQTREELKGGNRSGVDRGLPWNRFVSFLSRWV